MAMPGPTNEDQQGSGGARGAKRPSKRRRLAKIAVVLVILGVGGWYIATRSFVTRWIGQAVMTSRLGVPVTADSVVLGADGTIVAKGLTIRSAETPGEAGDFARADAVEVRVPWWRGIWGGDTPVRSVVVDGLRLRISQSVETGKPNFPAFRIKSGGGDGPLPVVEIRRGHFELSEHEAGQVRVLRSLDLTGTLEPGAGPDQYVFNLRQTDGGTEMLAVTGAFNGDRVNARIGGVALDMLDPASVPAPLREMFRKLDLAGRITGTTFEYVIPAPGTSATERARGIEASLELEDVAVTLPFEDLSSDAPAGQRYPRLRGVSGRLTASGGEFSAELKGKLEDLPAEVALKWRGITATSPFEATISTKGFRLERNPRLLPFLPSIVHKRLGMFSNPQGIVDSRVIVTRSAVGGEPKVSGTLEFRDGVASFVRFPYEFRGMTGLFEFDDSKLQIVRVDGKAANGATLHTHGLITPLTDEASVKLVIDVDNIPVDESLAQGLGPRRRHVLDALFSRERLQELTAAGLIVGPPEGAKRQAELAEAKQRLARLGERANVPPATLDAAKAAVKVAEERASTPVFDLSGMGKAHLVLETPFGRDMPWTQLIEIEIPTAGLLPKRFPLPIVATGVKLLVDDTVLSVEAGTFRGLRGGEATVHARADFSSAPEQPKPEGTPAQRETDITINASKMPFDDLLINAIPAKDNAVGAGTGADRRTLGQVLGELNLTGTGDATVWIGDVAPGEIGFKARVAFKDARCAPVDAERVMLEHVSGTLDVNDEALKLSLGGRIPPASDQGVEGRISIELDAAFPGKTPPTFDSRIEIGQLDATVPIERAVGLFSPQAEQTLKELRDRYEPAGVVDVRTRVTDRNEGPMRVEVEATGGRGVQFTYVPQPKPEAPAAPPVRVAMGPWTGGLKYVGGTPDRVEFRGLAATLESGGVASGSAVIDGVVEVTDGLDAGSLNIGLTDARFETPIVRTVMAERLSTEFATFIAERNPRGVFDLAMKLDRPTASERRGDSPWQIKGTMNPRSLAVHGDTVDVEMPAAAGEIGFTGEGGEFRNVAFRGSDWSAELNGDWTLLPEGSSVLHAKINGESKGISASLMSLMPETVRALSSDLKVGADGGVSFRDIDLTLHWAAKGAPASVVSPKFDVSGLIGFAGGKADIGVEVTDATGSFRFEATRDFAGKAAYRSWASLDEARAAKIRITDVRAFGTSGENAGETFVPEVHGKTHGGVFSVSASLKPVDPGAPDGAKQFSTELNVAGVRLGGVLNDLSGTTAQREEGSAKLDGNVTLGGNAGDVASRRGRGSLTAGGGAVIDMPILLPMIQASNFQLPGGEQLDTSLVSFFVAGPTIAVERVSVLSPSVELRGFGTVTWPDMDLYLIFNSLSNMRVPVLSSVIEGVRNELVTTVVRGTAKAPQISVQPFRTARATLTSLFKNPSDAERLMSGLEARAGEAATRRRVAPERVGVEK